MEILYQILYMYNQSYFTVLILNVTFKEMLYFY